MPVDKPLKAPFSADIVAQEDKFECSRDRKKLLKNTVKLE